MQFWLVWYGQLLISSPRFDKNFLIALSFYFAVKDLVKDMMVILPLPVPWKLLGEGIMTQSVLLLEVFLFILKYIW